MKREITQREIILIGIVIVAGLLAAYYLLWYTPITKERDSYIAQASTIESEVVATQAKVADNRRMQDELSELFANNQEPPTIAKYDNIKPLMRELNEVLAQTNNFSLSFGAVDTSSDIVRRSVSLTFSSPNYAAARKVLEDLSKGQNRCMLDAVSLSFSGGAAGTPGNLNGEAGPVSITATLVYFEYKE